MSGWAPSPQGPGWENLCEEHQEPLKLFCQDDKKLIYGVGVFPKCLLLVGPTKAWSILDSWWSSSALCFPFPTLFALGRRGQKLQNRTYKKLHKLLEKQESSFLAQLEQLDTEIRNTQGESFHRFSEEMMSLGTLIGEMERTHQQPDLELLKVRAQAFQTCWEGKAWRGPNRVRVMGRDRKSPVLPRSAAMSLTLSPPPAQMTLDPRTANGRLYLSEDCKLVRWEPFDQDLPSNPWRFKVDPCVLGSRGFTSGWHRWDVEICREGFWAIGVVKESVPRGFFLDLNPNKGIWALCHDHGECVACTSPDLTPLTLRTVPQQIRICLDYEEGRVVFFDAESKERIFAFLQASFQGERVFPWFMVMFGAQLRFLPQGAGQKKANPQSHQLTLGKETTDWVLS
uniref:B30.2/SPRY domain-containing protein n=1 Tax=Calidris pygmaea TaxID=425635 RepID=A0A8C3K480_9CHAR